jgi:putative DNA primase/helicase
MTEAQKQTWKNYKQAVLSKLSHLDIYGEIKGQQNGSGDWVKGFCPFHNDKKTRSFAFNKQNKSWACFGNCGKGSAFDFIMHTSGGNFKDTLIDMGNKLNISSPIDNTPSKTKTTETKFPIPEKLVEQYAKNTNKNTLEYFQKKRGLTLKTIEKYQLGWDTKTKRYTIPIRDHKNKLGNIRLYNPHASDAGFKMISYSVLKRNPKDKNDKWRYGEARLYGLDDLVKYKGKQVIICEGEWDRLILQQNGFMAITGTCGAGSFQKKWVKHFKGKDVVLALDCDEPGKEAAKKILELFSRSEINSIKNIALPLDGTKADKDISDYFHKHGFKAENFQRIVNNTLVHEYPMTAAWFDLSTGTIGRFLPQLLAEHIMDLHHFVYDREEMYVYQDGVYQPNGKAFIYKEVQKVLREEFGENKAKEVAFCIQTKICNLVKLDKEPRYINLENGLLDWINPVPELKTHTQQDLSSIRIPLKYNIESKCTKIDKFLEEILPAADCIPLIEELFGYCMIPDTRFEKAFMFVGKGANGKSTLLKLLQAFIGKNNVSNESLQQLADDKYRAANLVGKLANVFPDLSDMPLENSGYFKALTSGDRISVERKHKDSFNMENTARLIFSANAIPRSKDVSHGFYRKWVILRFPNEFKKGSTADESLINMLTQEGEMSGFLNKAIAGLVRLFTNRKFTEPESIKAEMQKYQTLNDTAKAFIDEMCAIGQEYSVGRKDLYAEYTKWCDEGHYRPVSVRKFNDRLQSTVSVREIRSPIDSRRMWKGLEFDGGYSQQNGGYLH